MSSTAVSKTLFPLGDYTKPEVRHLAKKFKLVTANKKESMGICFVGKVGIKDFLIHELGEQQSGEVINENGQVVGRHDGAIFYTIGQRHGLDIGGGMPYYVTGKDMKTNKVFVSRDLNNSKIWTNKVELKDIHWINTNPSSANQLYARYRHRAPLVSVSDFNMTDVGLSLSLKEEIRAVTAGQSVVLYQGDAVLGGGVIC